MSSAELQEVLDGIVRLGYWQGANQQAQGITDISMPILDRHGHALAVLTCPFMQRIDRHVGADLDATRELLAQAASEPSLAGKQ